jgi:N-methylhydantoinase A
VSPPKHRVGIDIGGTFTDLTFWRGDEQRFITLKVPTRRDRPADGVMEGLARIVVSEGIRLEDLDAFVHGTTIALNTLIQRDGARLGLLVTRGFRDLLVIQRLRMPNPYNWRTGRPEPLLPRRHVFEIGERIGPNGEIEQPIAIEDVDHAVDEARAAGLDGLVVCFLHAYREPAHERAAALRVAERSPGLFACCSHEIWPRMREYERALISIMNGYVVPKIEGYLGDLEAKLATAGTPARPYITQSTGGIVTAASARARPVDTLLSGPAAGVVGALHVARLAGVTEVITLDIGGTSADVAFINGGRARMSQSEHVADFPLLMPVIGVSSIGAGGGSIITVDAAGVLRVGPGSVGAEPGPACYGRGGLVPAVTDAFLVGGHLNPATFAGGSVALSQEAARAALEPVAAAIRRDIAGTVDAVIEVAASSIYAELSNLAAKQGVSLSDYALMPFGGAGPLLAARVAEELGINTVLVPAAPGTLCSLGALLSDVVKPFVRSVARHLAQLEGGLAALHASLSREAEDWLAREAPELQGSRIEIAADMRYVGQSYEIDVDIEAAWLDSEDISAIARAFHARHRAMFAHADEAAPIEVVDLRLTIAGATPKPVEAGRCSEATGAVPTGERAVAVAGRMVDVPIYSRATLGIGGRFAGPAVVEQVDTTIFIPPGWSAAAHASGALILERIRA